MMMLLLPCAAVAWGDFCRLSDIADDNDDDGDDDDDDDGDDDDDDDGGDDNVDDSDDDNEDDCDDDNDDTTCCTDLGTASAAYQTLLEVKMLWIMMMMMMVVATGVPIFKPLVWLDSEKSP